MMMYTVDILQSEISFTVKLLSTKVKGTFDSYSSALQVETLEELSNAHIEIEIDVASLNTNEPLRDQHLKSADFFHTDLYPKIYFKKTSMVKHTDLEYLLTGQITIKNITKQITFNVVQIPANTPIFVCTAEVNRKDFDLVYNPIFEKMNKLDEIVHIHVQFTVVST